MSLLAGPEADALRRELIAKLSGLRDEETGRECIRAVYATDAIYKGPYLPEAPDLIVGYSDGYRTSWDAAVGKVLGSRIRRQSAKRGAVIMQSIPFGARHSVL